MLRKITHAGRVAIDPFVVAAFLIIWLLIWPVFLFARRRRIRRSALQLQRAMRGTSLSGSSDAAIA